MTARPGPRPAGSITARRAVVLLAAAVLALVALPWTSGAAAPVRAAAPGYVGIVIGGQGASCVRWHSGITGDEVLNDVAAVRYRNDGLITQIGGRPSSNTADSTHYWSYWHDTSGSWQYSSSGASGYSPRAGSVEGWSYVDGSSSASPPGTGAGGLYGALCGSRDAASAASTRPPTTRASTSHASTSHAASSTRVGAASTARGTSAAVPAGQGSTAPTAGRTSAGGADAPTASSSGGPGRSTTGSTATGTGRSGTSSALTPGSTTAAALAGLASLPPRAAVRPGSSNGSALPVILGVMLVALLGAGAGWGVVRRRRADAEH